MQPAPAKILKIAREFLGLSQDEVEGASNVSRKTIQRIERGDPVEVAYIYKLQLFYMATGITFVRPTKKQGWGVFNVNTKDDPSVLNRLKDIPPGKRKRSKE
ncbi:helix-turn-helix transcriptional regulator [Allorhizobium undicola]|uniref:helix-turn-helix transcriptional regulator n=1 Tax=Allorhizobium undicola TaxID=78527 RepID=UPI003D33DB69